MREKFRRKAAVSRKKNQKQSEAREPWEQSIYEPDNKSGGSRLEKRHHKRGNTAFLTILVILLLCIIALPIGTFLYVMRDKPNANAGKDSSQPSSSLVQSSTKGSSSKSSSTETSTESASSESSSSSAVPENQQATPSSSESASAADQQQTEPVYDTVLSGEGFKQVAARNGITLDQLLALNPSLTVNSMLHPGDTLRVK
ncbi:SAG1386/EF1546 family surface-associated protein [Enterococcus faecalis]